VKNPKFRLLLDVEIEQLTAQGMEHSSAAEEVVARGLTERASE
jgi:hypothetical protein